jgi:HAD superfamily hydrolase (TIGR01509 family)
VTAAPPAPRFPVAAVLFDCDGVLADSEGPVNRLVAEELTARGWPISAEACRETFLGMALPAMLPVIEARVGPLPARWAEALSRRIAGAMCREVEAVPGALDAVRAVAGTGLPVAVASNSARAELEAKLERLGLLGLFAGRVFSFEDVARPKPAPDIYQAAARACGAAPGDCVVVEDSLLGVRAGVAAGCRVLGLARETDASVLAAAGAAPFASMAALPGLLGLAAPAGGAAA